MSEQFEYLLFSNTGGVPQVFLTAPSGTVQIPVSAVQLHQVGGSPFHPIPASQLLLYLDLGDSITSWSKLPSLARRPIYFPGQNCGGQAGKQEEPELADQFLPPFPDIPTSLQMAVIGQQAGSSSSNLTELQVVNLDAAHSTKRD